MKTLSLGLALAMVTALLGPPSQAADVADAGREARWQEVSKYIFGDRKIEPTDSLIKIEAPSRALDAALVPITLRMPGKDRIKGVYLVIDENPSPFAAHFSFGPAADPSQVKLRVRINSYTNVHAIAETGDGQLFEAVAFVKASGGCSAPMGVSDEEAMNGMGEMRMKFAGGAGESLAATLMIRHPNFNGMQMNQITRTYTPARYINRITVSYGDNDVVSIDGDISVSSDPVFGFSFLPEGAGPVRVIASDTAGGHWEQTFNLPALSN
ncbi:MAG TPA: quinoprotein dehydrogenase-associated SoxYZ-like carrier [Candidatus Acidoferrum sp.]|nr:quinoprotein dehydrogenase-associated SoxYZ-like carrier [Candidatus Acidoferrum sp.]